jgi:hypothetical protein
MLASTFRGAAVRDVAIKKGTHFLAGRCVEGDAVVWRLRETGEEVIPTEEDGWVIFSIREA